MRYEIIDHGVDHSQYFQGCGTSFTSFDDVVTGIGSSYKEALEDALESMAQFDVTIPAELEAEAETADDTATVEDVSEESEMYYHVSIRWSNVHYRVVVGNIGEVYGGTNKAEADKHFEEYVSQSKSEVGRAGSEDVTVFADDEPIQEFQGSLSKSKDVDD